jgi:hypothetical protein
MHTYLKSPMSFPTPLKWQMLLPLFAISAVIAAEPAKPDEEHGPQVSRDAHGNAVISITDEAQGDMGIKVEKPAVTNLVPELKAYGRVMDPAPLASAINDIAVADAAYKVSSNELSRLQLLQGQGNASPRVLQAGEAAAAKDQLAAQAVRDKFALAWGKPFSTQQDLPAFVQGLISRDTALIRIDLAAGEIPTNEPASVRLVGLAGKSSEAQFLGVAPGVDPQTQGKGYFFLAKPNPANLMPNQALTAWLRFPGEPLAGVTVPDQAVVRTEGAGWVYILKSDGGGFTRMQVALDRPLPNGWFVTQGVSAENYLVTTGAQQLLSIEQKGKGD